MKTAIICNMLVGMVLSLSVACADTLGTTWIKSGETFQLGGTQKEAYEVSAKNVGRTPVVLGLESKKGEFTPKATIKPGESVTLAVPAKTFVLARSTERKMSALRFSIQNPAGLAMSYRRKVQE